MAAVGEAGADRFRPHAEALTSLGVTLEGVRDASEEMISDALSSVGISLEEVRREAGDVFDMSIPDERRIPFSPRAKKALELYRRLGFEPTTPSYPMMSLEEGAPEEVFGAANAHIPFGRNFMEIVSVATKDTPIPTGANLVQVRVPPDARKRVLETIRSTVTGLASFFSRFQGLHILVFQTPDIEATAGHLGAVGVGHSGPLRSSARWMTKTDH